MVMQPNHQLCRTRTGSIMLLTAFAAIFMVGMTALVTDVGYLYYNQSRLQTAVNAGWKAGYDKMMQLKGTSPALSTSQQQLVRFHVLEVMKANGYTDAELTNVSVTFGVDNRLDVNSRQTVGLFFAKAMNYDHSEVFAGRMNHASDAGQGIVPLAIPHGETRDLSKNIYDCNLFDPTEGFASGTEYILKLGSGGGNTSVPPDQPDLKMILVPMEAGAQSDAGFLRAYGAAFWCLKISDGADIGFTPVQWLLGYRGGAFMLPYDTAIINILNDYAVNYEVITGSEAIQAIYDQVNPNILELKDRPRIAVYSSQSDPDPVETVLRDGKIPYGTYSLPRSTHANGWRRNDNYSSANTNRIYDGEILSGALDSYHWVHLHHEDFTGFNGGCIYWAHTCEDFLRYNRLGTTNNNTARTNTKNRMCSYCRDRYKSTYAFDFSSSANRDNYTNSSTIRNNVWTNATNLTNVRANCLNKNRRCAEKSTYNSLNWRDLNPVLICAQGDDERPQCREYNTLISIADSKGYTSDAGSEPKPQKTLGTGTAGPSIAADEANWFNLANKVQKMKWDVAKALRNHVEVGGFLFAQCFAPETLDISLWQSAINEGLSPADAYARCLAFQDFEYKRFPLKSGSSYYSTVNSVTNQDGQSFNLLSPLDPRCQNHGNSPDTGSGHTSVFRHETLKTGTIVLGNRYNDSSQAKYIKGVLGTGEFTFLGGHYHNNTESKRLVLNNILLGSLVDKQVGGSSDVPVAGKQKSNYGPVDPDNINGGGANDFRDRFMHGFNAPIEINDRLLPESGNMRGPTDQAVDFRVNGDAEYPPKRIIIVPITDVGPEIPLNNAHNIDAQTIYDLQGNDQPNGAYRPETYGFGSSVRIIGFAAFEVLDPSEYTRDGEDYANGDLGPYQPGQVRGKFLYYVVKPGDAPVN